MSLSLALPIGATAPIEDLTMYNTIMAVATGVALLLIVQFGTRLHRREEVAYEGWAVAFGVLGTILTLTGLHMSLTWPLPKVADNCCTHDNIVFGEPSLAFGLMLLGATVILWRRANTTPAQEHEGEMTEYFARLAQPISWFAAAMGCALFAIAVAGVKYKLFAAPPQEPISGEFADKPLLEASFISALWAVIGLGAVLLPFALRTLRARLITIIRVCWTAGGAVMLAFGILNYFTHIGLLVNSNAG
ncbi:MAG TPA: DUF981 family protein [Solirubrobacteraceae bacterium]|nr:DUF981 family protein [Solirubrobacteraceae bacterium]